MLRKLIYAQAAFVLTSGATAMAAPFTFASHTFEQGNTPDVLGLLGNNASAGGAAFSPLLAQHITQSVGFIATSGSSGGGFTGAAGYDPSLSLGKQATAQHGLLQPDSSPSLFTSAINLPRGNNGATTRHGLEFSWTAGRALVNGTGSDLVIYESGSNSVTPEGMMVRARNQATGLFSPWYYAPAVAYQEYVDDGNSAADDPGAFAFAYDLSSLGLPTGAAADLIQVANLVSADRISGAVTFSSGGVDFGAGQVVFDGSSAIRPDAGVLASFRGTGYGSSTLDPDPLYAGVTGVVPEPVCGAMLAGFGLMLRRRR